MILRRLSTALRTQDWITVLIETLIVVFGVFIALQVNNWNAARTERTDARIVLEHFEQDFEQILDRTDRSIVFHENNLAAAGRLIRGIRSKTFYEETLLQDMTDATSLASPPGTSATFTQLISSGHLDLIRSRDLRRSLIEYDVPNLGQIASQEEVPSFEEKTQLFFWMIGQLRARGFEYLQYKSGAMTKDAWETY